MGWRIGLVGGMAAVFAGCLEPPAPGGAGDAAVVDAIDASPIDAADASDADDVEDGEAANADDLPDVPVVARDTAESDPPAIDLLTDPNNCGAPGVQCSRALGRPLVRCEAGRCVCGGNRAACGSPFACATDLDVDNRHCGSCDGVCSADTECVSGRCVPCPEGYGTCGSLDGLRCRTPLNSVSNCGGCGVACPPEGVCVRGRCLPCPEGYGTCGSPDGPQCSTRLNSVAHCGACGVACSPEAECVDGRCVPCPEGYGTCGSSVGPQCTTPLDTIDNCGVCGRVCGSTEFCVDQICQPCPVGLTGCFHRACVDLQSDPTNCGACGARCLDGLTSTAVCAAGVCARTCRPGYASCGVEPTCDTELAFSDEHCGRCDVRCGALSHCIGGVCTSLAARPVAPLSPVILGVQRPRFRWERADGVDGVRLQLCADRSCTRVESTRDLSVNEYQLDVALTPGVHFWRLFALRGGTVSVEPSPVWEFVVPAVENGREINGLFHDIDGDGVEDAFLDFSHQFVRHSVAPGEVQTVPVDSMVDAYIYRDSIGPEFSPDIDGDGYGDLVGSHFVRRGAGALTRSCTLLRGGATRFSTTLRDVGAYGSSDTGRESAECPVVFDLNGDGHGDIVSRFSLTEITLDSYTTREWVHFGGQNEWTTPASNALATVFPGRYPRLDWADFNGDGRADLLHVAYHSDMDSISTIDVISFARGVNSPDYLPFPRCGLPPPATIDTPFAASVVDADHDGFDDLQVIPYIGGAATYFGGPGGFTRCVYVPPRS